MSALQQPGRLARLLDVQPVAPRVYVGQSEHLGFQSLFGGQVLGQAVVASSRTVSLDRPIHSLHAYFLRPGSQEEEVRYEVEVIRDGTSFATRRVVAVQSSGTIFCMIASYQRQEEGFEHGPSMPSVIGPDSLINDKEIVRKVAHLLPVKDRDRLLADYPVEIRSVEKIDLANPSKRPPYMHSWQRVHEQLPDDPILHQGALAYASDFGLLTVSLLPHGATLLTPGLKLASVDHAMWFHHHRPWTGWRLYARDSPIAAGGRGMNHGQIYDADGTLVASTAQESLIRVSKRP
ncbi:MAG: acyl-CoA thioesterase II [Deltaproteobacteria bacterium]|nr:acyl-CoA thioesterase II [Deltaproteobacteria bacterium]